jgi:hypothetical protein
MKNKNLLNKNIDLKIKIGLFGSFFGRQNDLLKSQMINLSTVTSNIISLNKNKKNLNKNNL